VRATERIKVNEGGDSRPICYLVVGNHHSHDGIYEIALTLHDVLAPRYRLVISLGVVPGEINLVIDEFGSPRFPEYLAEVRRDHPGTKYVVVATEFVTPVKVFGFELFKTFNFLGWRESRRAVADILISKVRGWRFAPYMHRRFLGFRAVLGHVDAIVSVTPSVDEAMRSLLARHASTPTAVIYPIVDLDGMGQRAKLRTSQFGVVMTGTATPYRAGAFDALSKAFQDLHWWNICHSIGYSGQGPTFELLSRDGAFFYPLPEMSHLFNFNPPQNASWQWSSVMRLYRATVLGQIPLVNRKFGDHEIEELAELWDGRKSTATRLLAEGTIGRSQLLERYFAAVERYNGIAHRKNTAFLEILDGLRSVPASSSP
jgi:hypothetical protein